MKCTRCGSDSADRKLCFTCTLEDALELDKRYAEAHAHAAGYGAVTPEDEEQEDELELLRNAGLSRGRP